MSSSTTSEDQSSSLNSENLFCGPSRKRRRPVQNQTESEDEGAGIKRRNNARVIDATWTPGGTVKITYDMGVKHACMNPTHGKSKVPYKVLHLVSCPWKNNVSLMKENPGIEKSKLYQYCHKLCDPCLSKYGPQCFKCDPPEVEKTAILDTVFGEEAISSAEDFVEMVKKWQIRRSQAEASYLVLHCTVLGKEARLIRQRFCLKRSTIVHVVYSDVRDKMQPAGSGINFDDSEFRDSWRKIMKEKVIQQNQLMISFFGNILLNNLTFEDFRVNDLVVMYMPAVFGDFEARVLRGLMNSLYLHIPPSSSSCDETCLNDAVVHTQRKPVTEEEQCLYDNGNTVASQFYKGVTTFLGEKLCAEFEQRAGLGQDLRIGEDVQKVPFHNLYVAMGGEVRLRRGDRATQDVARRAGDARSRVCTRDTSGYEIVCWTRRGAPEGGDFVIPGLMYKFAINQGSSLVFRPKRYFHATLSVENRDLRNESFAASFVTPT